MTLSEISWPRLEISYLPRKIRPGECGVATWSEENYPREVSNYDRKDLIFSLVAGIAMVLANLAFFLFMLSYWIDWPVNL